jgi:hypothetical protein
MPVSRKLRSIAIVGALAVAAGCGGKDFEIILDEPTETATPAGPVRTPTPTAVQPTPTETPAAGEPTPTPTETPGDGVDAEVESVVQSVVPFLTIGVGLTTGVGATGQAVAALRRDAERQDVDDCPNGGTRTEESTGLAIEITLDQCRIFDPQLGNFEFDGTIDVDLLAMTVTFDVSVTDLDSGVEVVFDGQISGTPSPGGGFVLNGGPITVETDQGNFTLTLNNLTIDGDGNLVSGGGSVEDTDDNFDLASVELTVRPGGQTADVLATFDDTSTATFLLDLRTGALTPAG